MYLLPQITSIAAVMGGGGGAAAARLALVRKASDQTTANYSGTTMVAWDTMLTDTDGFWSSGDNTKLTIPAGLNGYYVEVSAQVQADLISVNFAHGVELYKNGAAFDGDSRVLNSSQGVNNSTSLGWAQATSHVVQVSTGDYFQARYYNSDSSVTISAASSSFSIRVIGTSVTGALLKKSADLTSQNLTGFPTVTFNSEVYDDANPFHDTGSNTDRITIPAAYNGRYAVLKASLYVTQASGNNASVVIHRNGTAVAWNIVNGDGIALGWVECQTPPILVATGDIFTMPVYASATSTIVAAGTYFSIEILPVSFQGVLAKLNADATANYTTPTAIAWTGADGYDTDAAHDPSSNNTKIIVPSAWNGKWAILMGGVTGTNDLSLNTAVSVAIFKGGTAAYNGFGGFGGHSGAFAQPFLSLRTQPILLTTGDEFTFSFWTADSSATILATLSQFGLRIVE